MDIIKTIDMEKVFCLFLLFSFIFIPIDTYCQSLIINDGASEIALDIYTIDDDGSFVFDPSNSSPYTRPINSNTESVSCKQERENSPDWHVMCGPTVVETIGIGTVKVVCENSSNVFCAKVLKSSLGH